MRWALHSAVVIVSFVTTATQSFASRHDCAEEKGAANAVILQKYDTALRGLQELRGFDPSRSALRRMETGGTDLILRKAAALDSIQLLTKRCSIAAKSKILGVASRYVLLSDKYLVRLQIYRNQARAMASVSKFSNVSDRAGLMVDADRPPMATADRTAPEDRGSTASWLTLMSEAIEWLSSSVDSAYLLLAALLTGIGGWAFVRWRKKAAAASVSFDGQASS